MDGVVSVGDDLVPHSLSEMLQRTSIEEQLHALTAGLPMARAVLVTHAPPYGTVCDVAHGHRHVGSRGLRAFIEQRQPLFGLHGHIHETVDLSGSFVERIGRTQCAAVGNDHRLDRPWVLEVELGEEPVVRRVRI
ncbi:hypothetical protein HFP89_01825 [Wenzhouxiangella sp. XN79A]|uniref:metallophosphoesterase family protein n=1 Tax=Wenzhouxiangella sp. XN79A TaxID=2724193 RepID=UPI00144A7BEA|nr:hypothetical protein [Wenzhouxiangella sp. XN79A]NKI33902.1 hypothetical protein [Wenzhouxiangella sp. XN79A]